MAKAKRVIYSVVPILERHRLIGWKVKAGTGYTASFFHASNQYKRDAIKLAVTLAKENQPSQVFIYSRSRTKGNVRLTVEWSYGADSKAKG